MVNDSSIIMGIILFFIAVGTLLPYINDAFGGESTQNLMDLESIPLNTSATGETECRWVYNGLQWQWICGLPVENSINAWDITRSITSMFFWSFGAIPLFLDLLIFVPLRILLIFLVYRSIRSGGG